MAKIIKTYESFILDGKFKFELNVIDPIIETIKNNQEFLTKSENLPQLAKLGYMYNTLWYSGRVCWGYDGLLLDKGIKKRIKDNDDEAYEWVSCEEEGIKNK